MALKDLEKLIRDSGNPTGQESVSSRLFTSSGRPSSSHINYVDRNTGKTMTAVLDTKTGRYVTPKAMRGYEEPAYKPSTTVIKRDQLENESSADYKASLSKASELAASQAKKLEQQRARTSEIRRNPVGQVSTLVTDYQNVTDALSEGRMTEEFARERMDALDSRAKELKVQMRLNGVDETAGGPLYEALDGVRSSIYLSRQNQDAGQQQFLNTLTDEEKLEYFEQSDPARAEALRNSMVQRAQNWVDIYRQQLAELNKEKANAETDYFRNYAVPTNASATGDAATVEAIQTAERLSAAEKHLERIKGLKQESVQQTAASISPTYALLSTLSEEEVTEYLNSLDTPEAAALASDRKELNRVVEQNRGLARTEQELNILESSLSDDYKIQSLYAYDPMLAQKLAGMTEAERKEEYRRQKQYGRMTLEEYEEALAEAESEFYDFYTNHYSPTVPASALRYEALASEYEWLLENTSSAWLRSHDLKYTGLRRNADFGAKSTTDFSNRDALYMYINNVGGIQDKAPVTQEMYLRYGQSAATATTDTTARFEKYKGMTEDEVATYNYLYKTQGKDAANEYLAYAEYAINARAMEETRQNAAKEATEHLGAASGKSVVTSLLSGIGYLDAAAQKAGQTAKELFGGGIAAPVDYNTSSMAPSVYSSTVIQTGAENLTNKYGVIELDETKHPVMAALLNGKSVGDVYQMGMSQLNSTAAAVASWLVPGSGLFLLAGSAATSTMLNTLAKGGSDEQALTMGLIAGVAEYFAEKVPMDSLLKGDWSTNVFMSLLSQARSEGREEILTSAINLVADFAVMGDKAEMRETVQAYIDKGMGVGDAWKKVLVDKAVDLFWDYAGGFALGGMSGPVRATIQTVVDTKNIGTLKKAAPLSAYKAVTQDLANRVVAEKPSDPLAKSILSQIDKGGIDSVKANDIYKLVMQNGETFNSVLSSVAKTSQEIQEASKKAEARSLVQLAVRQAKEGTVPSKTYEAVYKAATEYPELQTELDLDFSAKDMSSGTQQRNAVKAAIHRLARQEAAAATAPSGETVSVESDESAAPVETASAVEAPAPVEAAPVAEENKTLENAPAPEYNEGETEGNQEVISFEEFRDIYFAGDDLASEDEAKAAYEMFTSITEDDFSWDDRSWQMAGEDLTFPRFRELMRQTAGAKDKTDAELHALFQIGLEQANAPERRAYRMQDRRDVAAAQEVDETLVEVDTTTNTPWWKQIDDLQTSDPRSALYIRETPNMLAEVGLGDLPLCMTKRHMKNVMAEEDPNHPERHGVSEEIVKKLPELLSKPVMILDSFTVPGDVVVVTSEIDAKGRPIVVTIHPNGTAFVDGQKGPANFITSIYGRENFAPKASQPSKNNFMFLALKNRAILYYNKNRSETLRQALGVQFPSGLNSVRSNEIIRLHRGYVKDNIPTRLFKVSKEATDGSRTETTRSGDQADGRLVGHNRGQQRASDQRHAEGSTGERVSAARGSGESVGTSNVAGSSGAREEVHRGARSAENSVQRDSENDPGRSVQVESAGDGDRRHGQGNRDVQGQQRADADLHVEGVPVGDRPGAGEGSGRTPAAERQAGTERTESRDAQEMESQEPVSSGDVVAATPGGEDFSESGADQENDRSVENANDRVSRVSGSGEKHHGMKPSSGKAKTKSNQALFKEWREELQNEFYSWDEITTFLCSSFSGSGFGVFDFKEVYDEEDDAKYMGIGVIKDGDTQWLDDLYLLDDEGRGLNSFLTDLPKMLSDVGVIAPGEWGDRSTMVTYADIDYLAVPAELSASKAHRDAQKRLNRVGYKAYVVDAEQIITSYNHDGGEDTDVQVAAGVTVPREKAIYSIGSKGTLDHESLHAYMNSDAELYFRIRDAVAKVVPKETIDLLRQYAEELWDYGAINEATHRYQLEMELFCEAYAGNTALLGRDIIELSHPVRKAVREWEKEWDAGRSNDSSVIRRAYNPFEIELEYEARGMMDDILDDMMAGIEDGWYDGGDYYQVSPKPDQDPNTPTSEAVKQNPDLSDFVKRFNEQYGEGAAESMFKNLQQLQRAEHRMNNRVAAARASAQAQKTLAEQRQKDMATAWIMYHKRTTRGIHHSYAEKIREIKAAEKAKADAAVREARAEEKAAAAAKIKDVKDAAHAEKTAAVQQARKAEADKGKQKLEDQRIAERMNAKRMAGKRLGVKDREITELKNDSLERAQIRRNASKATLHNKNLAEKKRAQVEAEQGPIDTIRKNPAERTFVQRLQESAGALRTAGRSLYRAFTSETEALERFAKRQKSGSLATTHVTVAGAASTTTERILREGLVARNGDTIGESMKDVFLCLDKKGRIDEAMQALLQDYMLHLHNVDRMSIVDNALKALQDFEAKNPWLREMPGKELGRLSALTDAETKRLGKESARDAAREYSRLMLEYTEAKNKPVFPDDNGKAISADSSREVVAKYEAENPWLKDKAQGIYDWWDAFMLEWVVGESLTLDAYHAMKKLYPHYVPTYRVDKGGLQSGGANASALTPGRVVKRAKGSLREIVNIEESFASLVAKSVKVARTNALYRNVVDTLLLDDGVGDFADMGYFDFDSLSTGSYYLDMLGRQTETHVPGMEPDVGIENSELAGLVKVGNDYRVSAWYDGELLSAYVSEDVFNALSAVAGASDGKFKQNLIKIGNMLTGPMKTAITGINPNFALRNLSRDLPTAIINSCSGLAFPKYWAQAGLDMAAAGLLSNEQLTNILKVVNVDTSKMKGNAARYATFRNLGGTHANYYNNNSGFAASISKGRNVLSKAVDAMGAFNEATEAMTRYAEYIATVERLGDTYENRLRGIKNSAEVTVDFSRSGSWGKVINAWVPYWNPAVQGIDKVFRSLVESPDGSAWYKQTLKTLGRAAMTTVVIEALQMVVLSALGRRDEWEKLSDRTKDTYYCIPLKDEHKFLRIPKNREWGAILGTPFSRLWEAANGREDPFENYLEVSIVPNFLPPTLLDAIGVSQAIDIAANKDFKGSPIVPYAYQNGSVAGQYDNDTSVAARWLSKVLGEKLSPMQIDYIISDYFGDFGDMAIQLLAPGTYGERSAEDVAQGLLDVVLSPWVSDMRYSNHDVSKYYEIVDTLERGYEDIRNHNSDPDAYKTSFEYLTSKALDTLYGKEITELNKSARTLPDGDEKDAIKEEIARLATEALSFYDACKDGKYENPKLVADYWHLPASVSEELIRLDGMTEDYSILPPDYTPKTYGDPKSKEGNKMTREYVLDEEAQTYYEDLRDQMYADDMAVLIGSKTYQRATDTAKCEMIEELKENVTEEVKEKFLQWLADNRRSVPKK